MRRSVAPATTAARKVRPAKAPSAVKSPRRLKDLAPEVPTLKHVTEKGSKKGFDSVCRAVEPQLKSGPRPRPGSKGKSSEPAGQAEERQTAIKKEREQLVPVRRGRRQGSNAHQSEASRSSGVGRQGQERGLTPSGVMPRGKSQSRSLSLLKGHLSDASDLGRSSFRDCSAKQTPKPKERRDSRSD